MTTKQSRIAAQIAGIKQLVDKMRARKRPTGMALTIASPSLGEIAGLLGYDFVMVDQEHTLLSKSTLIPFGQAIETGGVPWLVKVERADGLMISNAMDAGASGVMIPYVSSGDMLREALSASRFPPDGTRGICTLSRATGYFTHKFHEPDVSPFDEYVELINEHMLIIPTIESIEGIENIDSILEVPDCFVYHVGIEDLMVQMLGEGFEESEVLRAALTAVKKIHAAGKYVCIAIPPFIDTEAVNTMFDVYDIDLPYTFDAACYEMGATHLLSVARSHSNSDD